MSKNRSHWIRGLLALALTPGLSGCGVDDLISTFHLRTLVTFFTAGPVAAYQSNLMLFTFVVMLFVLVPVVGFTLWFAWHYRASNSEADYRPNWDHSIFLEFFLWGGPLVIILVLGTMTWMTTHDMDPYAPIDSEEQPIRIEAIALDWKWLFIYPEYQVAAVNEMAMPVDVPVSIHLTSNTVMNAFMIPRLGSQIFAMSGMRTQLNLMATQTGSFFGKNYQYSGKGFNGMHFQAISMPKQGFENWIDKAKAANRKLDMDAFEALAMPSQDVPVSYYSAVTPHLFDQVIARFDSGYEQKAGLAASESAGG